MVVAIYLVALVGACLYVPSFFLLNGFKLEFYGRVALELIGLTAVAGVLILIGSLTGAKKCGQQLDPPTT
jgi:hypothetical protein